MGLTARRSQQFCGDEGDADLAGVEGIAFEVKRRERASYADLNHWLTQAVAKAKAGDVAAVLTRRSRFPWLLTIDLNDLPQLAKAVVAITEKPRDPER